jgi:hypothetical protein
MAAELSPPPPAGPLGRLRAELEGNPRALAGVAVIALILIVWIISLVDTARVDADERLVERLSREATLTRVVADSAWPERAAASDAARAVAEQRLWRGATEGLARAEFQDWLSAAGRSAGVQNFQIRVEPVPRDDLPPGVSRLVATVAGDFAWAPLQGMLAALAASDRLNVVEALAIQTDPLPRFDGTIAIYVRIGDGS